MKLQTGCKIQVTRFDGAVVWFTIEGPFDHIWRGNLIEKLESIVDNSKMVTPSDLLQTLRKLNIEAVEVTVFDKGACGDYAALVEVP